MTDLGHLSMQESSYFNRLIHLLEQMGPSESEVKSKRVLGAVLGLLMGIILSFVPGSIVAVGLITGLTLGCRWAGEYDRMMAALKRLPEGEKDRLIGVAQGVVGGSSDIRDVENLLHNWRRNKLLNAMKQNLNINAI